MGICSRCDTSQADEMHIRPTTTPIEQAVEQSVEEVVEEVVEEAAEEAAEEVAAVEQMQVLGCSLLIQAFGVTTREVLGGREGKILVLSMHAYRYTKLRFCIDL